MKGLGFLPDDEALVGAELRERHARGLVDTTLETLPERWDLSPHVETIPNQGSTSSCVGHALATSLEVRGRVSGSPIARPSAKAIYDVARMVRAPRRELGDFGCQPSAAIDGISRYGLVAEARWPLDEANVNELPPLDVFAHGVGALLGAHYRIPSGLGAAGLLRRALHAGYVPVFAMTVDDAYFEHAGRTAYRAQLGPVVGSHMQALVGYLEDVFVVANSWGTEWGTGGFALLGADFLESAACSSFIVPTILPLRVT